MTNGDKVESLKTSSKKLKVSVMLLLAVLAVLLLASYFYVTKPPAIPSVMSTTTFITPGGATVFAESLSQEGASRVLKELNKSISSGDISGCEKVSEPKLRDLCVYNIAVRTVNSSLCSMLLDVGLQGACSRRVEVSQQLLQQKI